MAALPRLVFAWKKKSQKANREALARILAAEPVLADVRRAGELIPELDAGRLMLHAGPPIDWARMCGPLRGAVCGAIVFEGWAPDLAAAEQLAASGGVKFAPNHHYGAVGPMTGITTRSMPLLVVENRAFGNRAVLRAQRRPRQGDALRRQRRRGARAPRLAARRVRPAARRGAARRRRRARSIR